MMGLTKERFTLRLLAWCGLISPLLFWGTVAILGSVFPGYSHLRDTVSELGAVGAPTAAWQNANFIVNGLLVAAFAWGLHRSLGDGRISGWGPALLGVFGLLGLFASGLLPCDLGCAGVTRADQLHFMAPSIGFPSVLAALFVLPRRMHQDASWQSFQSFTRFTAWFGLIAFIAMNMAFMGFLAAAVPYVGLLQRLFAGSIFLWIFAAGLRTLRISKIPTLGT